MYYKSCLCAFVACGVTLSSAAAESPPVAKPAEPKPTAASDAKSLLKKFEETVSGTAFVGRFTITGKNAPPEEERYEIAKITKLPSGDLWLFQARIKYGDKDITVPLPLEVKWAGDTPVITLNKVAIPGLGTFDARVVVDGDKYAGTWTHDTVGGHLFGRIEKLVQDKPAPRN